jgi:hypothetical protein
MQDCSFVSGLTIGYHLPDKGLRTAVLKFHKPVDLKNNGKISTQLETSFINMAF